MASLLQLSFVASSSRAKTKMLVRAASSRLVETPSLLFKIVSSEEAASASPLTTCGLIYYLSEQRHKYAISPTCIVQPVGKHSDTSVEHDRPALQYTEESVMLQWYSGSISVATFFWHDRI